MSDPTQNSAINSHPISSVGTFSLPVKVRDILTFKVRACIPDLNQVINLLDIWHIHTRSE